MESKVDHSFYLKSCPFCGHEPSLLRSSLYGTAGHRFHVCCSNPDCKSIAQSRYCFTAEEAVSWWNRRKPLDNVEDQKREYVSLLTGYLKDCDSEKAVQTKRDISNTIGGVTTAFYCLGIINQDELQKLAVQVDNHYKGVSKLTKDGIQEILRVPEEALNAERHVG